MKITVAPKGKRYIMVGRFGVVYAEKNSKIVLKTETSWKKISGFFINTNKGCVWFYFRRH